MLVTQSNSYLPANHEQYKDVVKDSKDPKEDNTEPRNKIPDQPMNHDPLHLTQPSVVVKGHNALLDVSEMLDTYTEIENPDNDMNILTDRESFKETIPVLIDIIPPAAKSQDKLPLQTHSMEKQVGNHNSV